MLFTTGGIFCGMYANVTSSRVAAPRSSAFHWMNLAFGLCTGPGVPIASDQSLQVLSGRSELPERVRNSSPAPSDRQLIRPHRATPPESCTGDSYDPALPG